MAAFPIRNDQDLDRALERIDALWGAEPGTSERDELDVLLVLVEDYEARHHEIPAGDPVEVIRYKLSELGMTQGELARRLSWGSGRVSEVLNRKRQLTLAMVRQISDVLGLAPGLLVGEERCSTREERTNAAEDHAPVLPNELMAAIRAAAARECCSVDTWIAQALRNALYVRTASADIARSPSGPPGVAREWRTSVSAGTFKAANTDDFTALQRVGAA